MRITYASHQRWRRSCTNEPLNDFSPKKRKRIENTLPALTDGRLHYSIEPLTDAFFVQFTPLYTATIGSREHAVIHDVYAKTLGNPEAEFPYYGLTIYDQNTYVGGSIFSYRPDMFGVAYRAFLPSWPHTSLQAGPTLLAEYLLSAYAVAHGIFIISHGKDRNPYGVHAAIGLATFKLSVGCHAYTPDEDFTVEVCDTDELDHDALILEYPGTPETRIRTAYLITAPATRERYAQLVSYADQLSIQVIERPVSTSPKQSP